MLSKNASSTIFWVFGMTQPGIEPRSPGPLANTLTIMPMFYIILIICLRIVKWFQALLLNISNSIHQIFLGHCWRSRDELISDVLLWTPTYGRAKAGWPARTYIQQLCEDTRCSPEDLPEAMNDREKWRERVRDIHASGTTWLWWIK